MPARGTQEEEEESSRAELSGSQEEITGVLHVSLINGCYFVLTQTEKEDNILKYISHHIAAPNDLQRRKPWMHCLVIPSLKEGENPATKQPEKK